MLVHAHMKKNCLHMYDAYTGDTYMYICRIDAWAFKGTAYDLHAILE